MIRQGPKRLGHATASITLDTYGHLFPDQLDALADRVLEKPQVSGLVGGVGGGT
jgi:integrase